MYNLSRYFIEKYYVYVRISNSLAASDFILSCWYVW